MSKGEDGEFTFDETKFAGVPLEEKERITGALHSGDLTDEQLLEAARAADVAVPPAEEPPADDEPAPEPEPPVDDEPDPEPEVDPRAAVAAKRAELRAKYNEDVAALKADIEAKEPEDKYSDEHDEWARKRSDALARRVELRDQLDAQLEEAETATYAEVTARTAGQRASVALSKVVTSEPEFASFKIKDVAKTVEKVYRPWLDRVVKANGGDPSKQEDVNAAWARFHSDPEFAKHPDIKSPEDLKDVLIAVTAYDGIVSRGMSPGAALRDAAEKNGVWGDWRAAAEAERKAKHEADLKGQATSVQAALSRRSAAEPPAATGSGPLAPSSSPAPTDLASAEEWMQGYFARVDAAKARGRDYVPSPDEKKLRDVAEEIITRETLPGGA